MPSSLHSRGALAGAGSAVSLIAAALVSLLFAAGFVAFTAWPAGHGSPLQSVVVPAAAPSAPGRATVAAPPAATAGPARVPAHRVPVRTVARSNAGRGPALPATATSSIPATTTTPPPVTVSPASGVTRQVTDSLAGTTSTVTRQVGSAVGGSVGAAVTSTGDQLAQTIETVGSATGPLLGG